MKLIIPPSFIYLLYSIYYRIMNNFVLLKKPTNLKLIADEYIDNEIVPACLQARVTDCTRGVPGSGISNTKLVKCADGEWYIKNGKFMLKLRQVPIKEVMITVTNKEGG